MAATSVVRGELGQAAFVVVLEDVTMGLAERGIEKGRRVLDRALGLILEMQAETAQGNLGGHLALHVSAHAVGHDHQQAVAGIAVPHAVLVDAASAQQGVLKNRKSHLVVLPVIAPVFRVCLSLFR